MKIQDLYKLFFAALCFCLAVTACQYEGEPLSPVSEGEGTLNLSFNLVPTAVSRSVGGDGVINLYYEAKDGQIVPCEAPEQPALTRAGDGNAADGGGMKDLAVFLVDANDNIVGRKSLSDLENVTTQSVSFFGLTSGTYTAYAYANTIGNDWFDIPSANATSFANYKEALLKPLTLGVPTLDTDRMPLTGKQELTVDNGIYSCSILMLRPVGKLSVLAKNEKTIDAVSIETPDFGAFLPRTGYVFKHDEILPLDPSSNPYSSITNLEEKHPVLPVSSHLVLDTYLYETHISGGFKIKMEYKGSDYTFQQNLSNALNSIKGETIIIKLYKEASDSSEELFLRLDQVDGQYQLGFVTTLELDEKCYWGFSSSGRQQRGLYNAFYKVFIDMSNRVLKFSVNDYDLHYSGSGDHIIIGSGDELTYNSADNSFGVSTEGTKFQFFTYEEDNKGGSISDNPIYIENIENNTLIPLTTILRNQHIKLNILFKD